MAIVTDFDKESGTLTISGAGDISWRDTVLFSKGTKHIVIEGNDIVCTNASNLFARFNDLVDIQGCIDTSICSDFSFMYAEDFKLRKPIKGLDTSKGIEFDFMHSDNKELPMAEFNSTECGLDFGDMFFGCSAILDIRNVTVRSQDDINTISNCDHIKTMITVQP